jgi:hypothetical protein
MNQTCVVGITTQTRSSVSAWPAMNLILLFVQKLTSQATAQDCSIHSATPHTCPGCLAGNLLDSVLPVQCSVLSCDALPIPAHIMVLTLVLAGKPTLAMRGWWSWWMLAPRHHCHPPLLMMTTPAAPPRPSPPAWPASQTTSHTLCRSPGFTTLASQQTSLVERWQRCMQVTARAHVTSRQ